MTDFVPFLPSLITCMHKAPQPHYWQTAWPVYAPQRQLAPRIPALIKESDGAITFSILSLSVPHQNLRMEQARNRKCGQKYKFCH